MKHPPRIFLEHILQSITLIEEYVQGVTIDEFTRSVKIQDLVMRRLEIIGEAVKNLPADVKAMNPDIPWKKIAGMRDVLIHDYFGVDIKLTWIVVQNELPVLKQAINEIQNWLK